MSPQVSAGTAARRTDATGGGNGAVVPAVDHSPGASFTITLPVARIGNVSQHAGETLVDLVMTGEQLNRAGLGTGAGIARLPRDPAPADNNIADGCTPSHVPPGGGGTQEEAPSAAGSVAGSIPASAALPPGVSTPSCVDQLEGVYR